MVERLMKIVGYKSPSDFPAKADVIAFTQQIALACFPTLEGGKSTSFSSNGLRKKFRRLLKPMKFKIHGNFDLLIDSFFDDLKDVQHLLEFDATFIAANDPAATSVDEVVMAYPGFFAILVYRIAHSLALRGVPIIPRIMTEYAHSKTGIDIHPKANIGTEFFIDHGTGIVIGETTIIGNRVKLYQGVTLGALSVSKDKAQTKRHPTIEDDVIIYAGSTILGGDTVIGHNSVIGGNVWLTESVQPHSMVYQERKVIIKERRKQ
jgi:serine O-acetyltransferase